MSTNDDIQAFLNTLVPATRKELTTVTPLDVNQSVMYHVSNDPRLKKFIPVIGFRQAKMEDRTVPRVCVAPSILGCLIGYAAMEFDFLERPSSNKDQGKGYFGGMKIYSIPFETALRPTPKLVYDADQTDEHWLVSYNAATATYPAKITGELFVKELRAVSRTGTTPERFIRMYLQTDVELNFSKNHRLETGCYQIDLPTPGQIEAWDQDDVVVIKPVSEAEYRAEKQQSAAMLSHEEPKWSKW